MKKRIASVLLALVLLAGVLPGTALASGGLSCFVRVNTYESGRFTDVATSAWYAPYAQAAYELGLMNGTSPATFTPGNNLTVAEAVKLAACLHSIYHAGAQSFETGTPWYSPYVAYAVNNGILKDTYKDYTVPATRSEFAQILSNALPEEALTARNSVADSAIPDVPYGYSYAPAVYELYRAGVLTGSDPQGHFLPNNTITRAEAAAVITRMADASFRQSITLSLSLTTTQIFEKCSPAVFYIEIYDIKDKAIKTGSGFFVDPSGKAVTNYHVVNGAAKAIVTTADGKKHDVSGIYGYSKADDLALLQIDGGPFPYLETAGGSGVVTGADAWAIGSPLGFKNSISQGLISSASRDVEGRTYIQTTAAISSGSSGGALLDSAGRVVGVTTATASGAQNINLAVPIGKIKDLKLSALATLKSILPNTKYYDNNYPVPDFGAFTGTPVYKSDAFTYSYRVSDIPKGADEALNGYVSLLEDNTFQFYGYAIDSGRIISYYLNPPYGKLITLGEVSVDGTECIRIQLLG
jgi:S1-C subfamily serine protease